MRPNKYSRKTGNEKYLRKPSTNGKECGPGLVLRHEKTTLSHIIKPSEVGCVPIPGQAVDAHPRQPKVMVDKRHVKHLFAAIATQASDVEKQPPNELARQRSN